jgi:predicted N-acetyltransferase YhbS
MKMIHFRDEHVRDVPAREALLDRVFGESRVEKTCERLREGRLPAEGLAFVVEKDSQLVGTVRLWSASIGNQLNTLVLGPLAVDAGLHGLGIGSRLMRRALNRAASLGHQSVLLVGDADYYARFGFSSTLTRTLTLPGPVERSRFLGLELVSGALAQADGLVQPTGRMASAFGSFPAVMSEKSPVSLSFPVSFR